MISTGILYTHVVIIYINKSLEYDGVTATSALESSPSSTSDLSYSPVNRSTVTSENFTDTNTDKPVFPGTVSPLPTKKTKLGKVKNNF